MDPKELERAALLVDCLRLYRADCERGIVRDVAEYAARFPGCEDLLARELAQLAAGKSARNPAPSVDALPGYRIVRELGRGGQGTVYLAEDLELRRQVALKVLRSPPGFASPARFARLRREVKILALLDHPGICTVYRAHLENQPPFVAMRYVPGPTLAELLKLQDGAVDPGREDRPKNPLPCRPSGRVDVERLLAFFEGAARALHVAHEAGVVHRDIKPANIVVAPDGEPVLLDFGLARMPDTNEATVTLAGELYGTPAYMSPEQLTRPADELDRRTDVYSLGLTAFECLTGRWPFGASDLQRTERAIRFDPAPRASGLHPGLPADLDLVLAKVLEKDRARRYATALELAEELRRVREHRPVRAQSAGLWLRARRWSQREPGIACALALLALAAAGLSVALVLRARALRVAESQNLAASALTTLELDPVGALEIALQSYERAPGFHSRSALLAALAARRVERVLRLELKNFTALTPDRRTLVIAYVDHAIVVIALPDGVPLRLGEVAEKPSAIAISPDGVRVAVGCEDGTLALFPGVQPLTGHESRVRALAFTADGRRLASGGDDGRIHVHVLGSGAEALVIDPRAGPLGGLRFAPDDRWLVSWSGEPERVLRPGELGMLLWDAADGSLIARLEGHTRLIHEARFSPDGSRVASGSMDCSVRVWKVPEGTCEWSGGFPAKVHDVAFSPDGAGLAVAYDPGEPGLTSASGASVLEAATGTPLLELSGHRARTVRTIDWSSDGKRLLTASYDGTARVWSAEDGHEISKLSTMHGMLIDARFLESSERMTASLERSMMIALSEDRGAHSRSSGHRSAVVHGSFSLDGKWLVTGDSAGEALVHEVATGELRARLVGGSVPLTQVAFCRNGSCVLAADSEGACRLYEASSGRLLHRFQIGDTAVNRLHVLADGESGLATSGARLVLFDLLSGALREFPGAAAELTCLDVSPDETLVAAGDARRSVRIWDLESGALLHELDDRVDMPAGPNRMGLFDVRFSPDGQRLLTAANDGHVRCYRMPAGELEWPIGSIPRIGRILWLDAGARAVLMPKWSGSAILLEDTRRGLERASLAAEPIGPIGRSTAMDVSPDGTKCLISSTEGRTVIWDLSDLSQWASVSEDAGAVVFAAFAPDGSCFATASVEGTVRFWPMDPEAAARAGLPERVGMPEPVGVNR